MIKVTSTPIFTSEGQRLRLGLETIWVHIQQKHRQHSKKW